MTLMQCLEWLIFYIYYQVFLNFDTLLDCAMKKKSEQLNFRNLSATLTVKYKKKQNTSKTHELTINLKQNNQKPQTKT